MFQVFLFLPPSAVSSSFLLEMGSFFPPYLFRWRRFFPKRPPSLLSESCVPSCFFAVAFTMVPLLLFSPSQIGELPPFTLLRLFLPSEALSPPIDIIDGVLRVSSRLLRKLLRATPFLRIALVPISLFRRCGSPYFEGGGYDPPVCVTRERLISFFFFLGSGSPPPFSRKVDLSLLFQPEPVRNLHTFQ